MTEEMSFGKQLNTYSYPAGSVHIIYITGHLERWDDHIHNIELIRAASPYDKIRLIINSGGGRTDIMASYIQALSESQAHTIGHAEGEACSAASSIWLSCKEISFAKNTMIMIHNYSAGAFGKGHELKSQILAYNDLFVDIAKDTYGGFLTQEEIQEMLDGKDFWFYKAEDITERLNNLREHNQAIYDAEEAELELDLPVIPEKIEKVKSSGKLKKKKEKNNG